MRKMRVKEKIALLSSIFSLISSSRKVYKEFLEIKFNFFHRNSYIISILEKDPLFEELQNWILNQLPEEVQKTIGIKLKNQKLILTYTGSKEHKIKYRDQDIHFKIKISDNSYVSDDLAFSGQKPAKEIELTTKNLNGKKIIFELLESLKEDVINRDIEPKLKQFKWSEWNECKKIPNRNIDSIILAEDQMERIVDDIELFLKSEDKYNTIGMPWHRGYLFYGPPGSGKSSIVMAIANHFKLDVNYLFLGDINTDQGLINMVSSVKGILLIEDADIFHDTVESRAQVKNTASLAGILNSLDGIATPDGLITIITTNNIDAFDKALIRPGRIDLVEKIDYLNLEQFQRLYKKIYKVPTKIKSIPIDITASQLTNIFKTINDPDEAEVEIEKIFKDYHG